MNFSFDVADKGGSSQRMRFCGGVKRNEVFCSLSVIMKSRSILNSMKICHSAAEGTQDFVSRGGKRGNIG